MGRIFCTLNMLIMCDFKKQFIRETVSQLNLKPAVLLYEDLVRILILESFNNWDSLIDFSWRLWSRKIEVSCFGDSNAGTFRVCYAMLVLLYHFLGIWTWITATALKTFLLETFRHWDFITGQNSTLRQCHLDEWEPLFSE